MPTYRLTNFEIRRYYQSEPRFNGVYSYSRYILPTKIKDGAYITNIDEHAELVTHWSALYCKYDEIVKILALNIFQKKLKNLLDIKT